MASDDLPLSTVRRLEQRSHHDAVRAMDPGSDDGEAAALWPVEDDFSLAGATEWLNSPPLTGVDLHGYVVLIHFWTYTCINWLRALPYLRAWEEAYRSHGLVEVGVHSPEFSFEHDVDNVRRAAHVRSIDCSIAIDNDFAVWRSFHNHFWPAFYVIDTRGRLRHHSFGEGGYEETEEVLRQLLAEAGSGDLGPRTASVEAHGVEAAADWNALRSAETYLGYDRTSGFACSGGLVAGRPHFYSAPALLPFGHWAVSGNWTVGSESTTSHASGARLSCRFQARDVHLVMAPAARGSTVRFTVSLDGRHPGNDHGIDVNSRGNGTITEPRLYQLLRRSGPVTESTVEIEFLDPGVKVYAFTFG